MDESLKYLGAVIIGGGITLFSNYSLEKYKLKKEIVLINKKLIDESYIKTYYSLLEMKKYYEKFTEPYNEFKKTIHYKEFGPLENRLKLEEELEIQEIFLDDDLKIKIKELLTLITRHCSIALTMSIDNSKEHDFEEIVTESSIENLAEDAIKNIDVLLTHIKKRFK